MAVPLAPVHSFIRVAMARLVPSSFNSAPVKSIVTHLVGGKFPGTVTKFSNPVNVYPVGTCVTKKVPEVIHCVEPRSPVEEREVVPVFGS